MRGKDLIDALKRSLRAPTDAALRQALGVSQVTLSNWRNGRRLTPRQVAGAVKRARAAAEQSLRLRAVRPLVEFFPLDDMCESKQGARYELFSENKEAGGKHKYLSGLKKELQSHHGVYIFFDSRGQAIYAGKARRQSLWNELNNAFNRARGALQKIKRVYHPFRDQDYRTSDEKSRQITDQVVPLYDLANYFSAYAVEDALIEDLESLLVRSFANDLLNKRMERFGRHRKAKATAKKRRKKR